MKKIILFCVIIVSLNAFSQNLNEYKYALLPSKFSFLKEPNQYRLNALSKLYLEKYGFETYFDTDIQPADFINFNCNKVFVTVISSGNAFSTKLTAVIKDCKGSILYTSETGISREKEYAIAYNEALRAAFESMKNLNHKYQSLQKSIDLIVEPLATNQMLANQYTALSTKNGFNLLINNNAVFQLFNTSIKDVFIAKRNEIWGVLLKKENRWYFEYYQADQLISEITEVKI